MRYSISILKLFHATPRREIGFEIIINLIEIIKTLRRTVSDNSINFTVDNLMLINLALN